MLAVGEPSNKCIWLEWAHSAITLPSHQQEEWTTLDWRHMFNKGHDNRDLHRPQ